MTKDTDFCHLLRKLEVFLHVIPAELDIFGTDTHEERIELVYHTQSRLLFISHGHFTAMPS